MRSVLVKTQLGNGVVPSRHGVDEEAVVLETLGQDLAQAGIILGHQDAHGQPVIGWFMSFEDRPEWVRTYPSHLALG
jgi:hypothetical protein